MSEKNMKEFWLFNNDGEAFVFEFPQPNSIHVIEKSAFDEVSEDLREANGAITDQAKAIREAQTEIARLKEELKASDFELSSAVKVIKHYAKLFEDDVNLAQEFLSDNKRIKT